MNEKLVADIIYLFVGVSVLLIGMKFMSSGLKKSIGSRIKRFFKKTQNNPFVSMGIGTVVTAGIQSSDATNAMVVGFINTGSMTIYQGLCIMLGAYIGTTVTGIIASFSSLSISTYFLIFTFVGVVLMFFSKERVVNIGEILCGFGLLFFGLAVMKGAFANPDITKACQTLFTKINYGFLLFLIGVALAALVQSSSAVTSIVIAMVGSGALNLSSGLYIALGATLGTVTNTLLSCLGGNIQGKRAAISAFFLRFVTSHIMVIFLIIFEKQIASGLHFFAINGSDELPIALFTVFYNIVFMPLLLPFLKPTIKLVTRIVKDKDADELSKSIHFIDDKMLRSPSIATMQVKKEIINMYELAASNYQLAISSLIKKDDSQDEMILDVEDKIDYIDGRITDFLIKLSSKVQPSDEKKIGTYFHVINDIERIGDHAINLYKLRKDLESKDLKLSKTAMNDVKTVDEVLAKMFVLTKSVFTTKNKVELKNLHDLEEETDRLKKTMSTDHYERIKAKKCKNELTPFYSSILTEFERIADYLTNIGYSIVNPLGDDR